MGEEMEKNGRRKQGNCVICWATPAALLRRVSRYVTLTIRLVMRNSGLQLITEVCGCTVSERGKPAPQHSAQIFTQLFQHRDWEGLWHI